MIQELAAALAAQVARQLGLSPATLRQAQGEGGSEVARLTHAFTEALTQTSQGPPGHTNAERASALATRFAQMAQLAARVTNREAGQPIRSIAGTSLDADTAGADPTPNPGLTPSVVATPSDGRRVAIASSQAIATGGDTLLGRMVARAYLAGDAASPVAPVESAPPATPVTSMAVHGTAGNGVSPSATSATPQSVVDAFLRAFTSALAHEAPNGTARGEGGSQTAAVPSQPLSSSAHQAPMPFALAVAHAGSTTGSGDATAAASGPSQGPHVDPHAVVEQVVRAMAIQTTSDGTSTIRLRLVPEQLGDVTVKLVVSGGSVDATVTARSTDAQTALLGGQSQLAKTLADAGLKLQSFSVGLAGGGAGSTGDQSSRDRATAQSQVGRIGGVGSRDAETQTEDLLAAPTFGPPLYTPNASLGALNYLV